MHPTVSEQLAGLGKALAEVVAPEVTNPYPADVLNGVIGALDTLARAIGELPAYLRWDAEETAAILSRVGVTAPPAPGGGDLAAIEVHHAAVRSLLESAIPAIRADPEADAAAVAHFRARIERFPIVQFSPRTYPALQSTTER